MVKYHVIHSVFVPQGYTSATLSNSLITDNVCHCENPNIHYSACSKEVYNAWRKVAFPFISLAAAWLMHDTPGNI